MEITFAQKEDLGAILALYKELNNSNDNFPLQNAEAVWNTIAQSNIKYVIARENDEVVAVCYIAIISNLTYNGRPIGYIENVITREDYRRKGIGRKVVRAALDYAQKENCCKAVLQSGVTRTAAHAFYESLGFSGDTKKAFEMRF